MECLLSWFLSKQHGWWDCGSRRWLQRETLFKIVFRPFDAMHAGTEFTVSRPRSMQGPSTLLEFSYHRHWTYLGLANEVLDSPLILCLYLFKMSAFLWRDCRQFLRKVKRLNSCKFLCQNKCFSGDDTEMIAGRIFVSNSFFQSLWHCICFRHWISWRFVAFWYVFFF